MSIFCYVLFVKVIIKLDVTCSSEITSRSEHDNDIYLDVEDEQVIRKVRFRDLVEMPKRERSKTPRRKMFTSHLLMSPENQQKIRQADEVARKKEQHIIEKQKLIKNLIAKTKRKKNYMPCR